MFEEGRVRNFTDPRGRVTVDVQVTSLQPLLGVGVPVTVGVGFVDTWVSGPEVATMATDTCSASSISFTCHLNYRHSSTVSRR